METTATETKYKDQWNKAVFFIRNKKADQQILSQNNQKKENEDKN